MQRLEDPDLQALCDRVIYDSANVLYALQLVPDPDRVLPGGWSARQIVGHLGAIAPFDAAAIARLARGEPAHEPGFDLDALNADHARESAGKSLEALVEQFREGRRTWLEALQATRSTLLPANRAAFLETMRGWATHYLRHGLELAEAFPEVRLDPFVLNWLLYATHGDEALVARQEAILAQVREHFAGEPEPGDEEE